MAQAATYLALVRRLLGPEAVGPRRLRIGASSLLDDILAMLDGTDSAEVTGSDSGY